MTLFLLSSLEGWPTVMDYSYDAQFEDTGPLKQSYKTGLIYILGFIVIGSFFFMNLFVGVIFDEFMKQSDKYNEKFKYLNEKQIQWIEMQPLIQKAKPQFNAI